MLWTYSNDSTVLKTFQVADKCGSTYNRYMIHVEYIMNLSTDLDSGVLKTFQVANKRADRLPTFPGRPNISCLVHTTGKHAVELQLYLYKHKPSFEMCFWPIWNMDSSHKQKRKPIYPFVRKWSKFLKNCLWQCLPWITQVWATIWILTPKQTPLKVVK